MPSAGPAEAKLHWSGVRVKWGSPNLGTPVPISLVIWGRGESISLGIWGPGVPRTLVIWGSVGDLGTQSFCSIHNLRRHVRTNCMCKSKNMFMRLRAGMDGSVQTTRGLLACKQRVGDAISVKTLVRRSPGLPDLPCTVNNAHL